MSAAPLEPLAVLAGEVRDTATCFEVSVVALLMDSVGAVMMPAVPVVVPSSELTGCAISLEISGVDASLVVPLVPVTPVVTVVVLTGSVLLSGSSWFESVPVLSGAVPLLEVLVGFATDSLSVDELADCSPAEEPPVPEAPVLPVSVLPADELELPLSVGDA